VIDNPVKEAEEAEMKWFQAKAEARENGNKNKSVDNTTYTATKEMAPPEKKSRIGKYLPQMGVATSSSERAKHEDIAESGGGLGLDNIPKPKPKASAAKPKMKFGNFSGW
jgi:hypothetical protein